MSVSRRVAEQALEVGGGGLGDLAVKYGYNRFQVDIMVYSVIILCVLVLLIQGICNFLYKILR